MIITHSENLASYSKSIQTVWKLSRAGRPETLKAAWKSYRLKTFHIFWKLYRQETLHVVWKLSMSRQKTVKVGNCQDRKHSWYPQKFFWAHLIFTNCCLRRAESESEGCCWRIRRSGLLPGRVAKFSIGEMFLFFYQYVIYG